MVIPAVSFASINAGFVRDLGGNDNDIVLYQDFLDTKSIYLTGNTTTIYAGSTIDLAKDGPVVVEVPAGPTAGVMSDLWFETSEIGRLGPDKGEGGKYLLVPPATKVSCRRKVISSRLSRRRTHSVSVSKINSCPVKLSLVVEHTRYNPSRSRRQSQ